LAFSTAVVSNGRIDPFNPETEERRMAKSMTKSAIIAHMSQKSGLAKKQVVDFFDQLEALAVKEAKNVFVLPQFGRLVLANRKARMGRNPQTGEPLKIPAKRVVKFRLAKSLKDSVLGKK
jgi:DNA-binding protein HU-beta